MGLLVVRVARQDVVRLDPRRVRQSLVARPLRERPLLGHREPLGARAEPRRQPVAARVHRRDLLALEDLALSCRRARRRPSGGSARSRHRRPASSSSRGQTVCPGARGRGCRPPKRNRETRRERKVIGSASWGDRTGRRKIDMGRGSRSTACPRYGPAPRRRKPFSGPSGSSAVEGEPNAREGSGDRPRRETPNGTVSPPPALRPRGAPPPRARARSPASCGACPRPGRRPSSPADRSRPPRRRWCNASSTRSWSTSRKPSSKCGTKRSGSSSAARRIAATAASGSPISRRTRPRRSSVPPSSASNSSARSSQASAAS